MVVLLDGLKEKWSTKVIRERTGWIHVLTRYFSAIREIIGVTEIVHIVTDRQTDRLESLYKKCQIVSHSVFRLC